MSNEVTEVVHDSLLKSCTVQLQPMPSNEAPIPIAASEDAEGVHFCHRASSSQVSWGHRGNPCSTPRTVRETEHSYSQCSQTNMSSRTLTPAGEPTQSTLATGQAIAMLLRLRPRAQRSTMRFPASSPPKRGLPQLLP